MKYLIIALFLISSLKTFSQKNLHQTNLLNHLFGCWTVKSFQYLPVSAIDENKAINILNKTVCLQNKQVRIFDRESILPNYKFSIINSNIYLYNNYGVTKTELGIESDSLIVINIRSSEAPKLFQDQELVLDYHNRMYFFQDGAMFTLYKRLNKRK
jgi:hypothetical protein